MPITIAKILPRTIKTILYKIVLRVITHASDEANKYLKFVRPTHLLLKIPTE